MTGTTNGRWSRLLDTVLFRSALRSRFEHAHERKFKTDGSGIVVGADTILLEYSSRRAALLLHGFNDTPQSMEYLARSLHAAGWTVLVPRLSGHGVRLPDMVKDANASNWQSDVERAYQQLTARYEEVVVCGQSMGGALAVQAAVAHPEIPALVLLAPYLGMPKRLQLQVLLAWVFQAFTPYHISSGGERSLHDPVAKSLALGPRVVTAQTMSALRTVAKEAGAELPKLAMPVLYLQSLEDNRIAVSDAKRHFSAIGSVEKVQRWLSGCGHIISTDYCRDAVALQVVEWFARYTDAESE